MILGGEEEGGNLPNPLNIPLNRGKTIYLGSFYILLGDYSALIDAINRMAVLGYCERVAWS